MTRFVNVVVPSALVVGVVAAPVNVGDIRRTGKPIENLDQEIEEAERKVEEKSNAEYEKQKKEAIEQINEDIKNLDNLLTRAPNAERELDLMKKLKKNWPSNEEMRKNEKKLVRHDKLMDNLWGKNLSSGPVAAHMEGKSLNPVVCSELKNEECVKWIYLMTGDEVDSDDQTQVKEELDGEDTRMIDNLAPTGTYTCTRKSEETAWEKKSYGEIKITKPVNVVATGAVEALKDAWDFVDLSGLKWEEWNQEKKKMETIQFDSEEHGFHQLLIWDSKNSEFFGTGRFNREWEGLTCSPKLDSDLESAEDSATPRTGVSGTSGTSQDLLWLWILLGVAGGLIVVGGVVYFVSFHNRGDDEESVSDSEDSGSEPAEE